MNTLYREVLVGLLPAEVDFILSAEPDTVVQPESATAASALRLDDKAGRDFPNFTIFADNVSRKS